MQKFDEASLSYFGFFSINIFHFQASASIYKALYQENN